MRQNRSIAVTPSFQQTLMPREVHQLLLKAFVHQHRRSVILNSLDRRQQRQPLSLHHIRHTDGATAVDAELTVHQHTSTLSQRLVNEVLRGAVVTHDRIAERVARFERHVRDVAACVVRTRQAGAALV